MTNKIFIFVNGILNSPGAANDWTDRAAQYVNGQTAFKGEKFEYFAGIFTRRLFQAHHANDLAKEIARFGADGARIVLVGHSNGCDLILRALNEFIVSDWMRDDLPFIEHVHLISAACERDFRKNGLNKLIEGGSIGQVTVYLAGADRHFCHPMWFARQSQKLIGWLGLGYGDLGGRGPAHCPVGSVEIISNLSFDHSDWFSEPAFTALMKKITA